jgi:disulfide bond formation protein DsbB
MAFLTSMSRRTANLLGFAACAAMMGFAYFAQYQLGLVPCNMCILQRICVVALGAAFLLAALHNPKGWGARIYAALIGVVALGGIAVSGRHVWMQAQPLGSLPSCGADFSALIEMMSFPKAVMRVLTGGGDCQAITWSLFGLSMPAWLLIVLVGLFAAGIAANLRRRT